MPKRLHKLLSAVLLLQMALMLPVSALASVQMLFGNQTSTHHAPEHSATADMSAHVHHSSASEQTTHSADHSQCSLCLACGHCAVITFDFNLRPAMMQATLIRQAYPLLIGMHFPPELRPPRFS